MMTFVSWIDVDKELRNLWAIKGSEGYIELVMDKYGWTEKQAKQNTSLISSKRNNETASKNRRGSYQEVANAESITCIQTQ